MARREWLARAYARLRREDRVDAGLAVSLAVLATVETVSGNYDDGPEGAVVVTGLLLTLPLALRRRFPVAVYAAALGMILAQAAVLGSAEGVGVFFALLVSIYTLAAHCPLRQALVGLALVVPVMALSNWRQGLSPVEDLDFIIALVVGFWAVGRVVRSRQRMVEQLSAQAEELERRRSAEARALVAEQRARIARDLHDVLAHSVSVMVVQAEAGEALLPDTDRSGQAMRAVQDTGRATLAELRQVLGALGAGASDVERIGRVPSPRLKDADQLVDRLRAAGLDVRLTAEGRLTDLPVGIDLAAYRVLQEALTNALRHAGRTSVVAAVRVCADDVVVDVVDDGPMPESPRQLASCGAGQGLAGMRERVRLYGGELQSGPAGAGFRVRARIPIQRPDSGTP
jgi:signal transduction histidine kinase